MAMSFFKRIEEAERRFRRSWGRDFTTPSGLFWARVHYHLFDHAFLRIWWTNFYPVAPDVWRSNQPTDARFRRYAAMGIKTVINLRGTDPGAHYHFEQTSCEAYGLTLVNSKLWARHAAPRQSFIDVIDALRVAQKPMMFHCKSGADRAGIVAAIYQMVFEDIPVRDAKKQLGLKFLHLKFTKTGVQDYTLDVFEARQALGPIGFEPWIRSEYDPDPLFAAFHAKTPASDIANTLMRAAKG